MKTIIRNDTDRKRFIDFVQKVDLKKPFRAIFEPFKKKRSLDQNSLLWLWMSVIEKESQYSAKEVYQFFCQQFLPWIKKEFWGRETVIIGGSSGLTTVEFNKFLEHIHQFAAEEGIYLPYPDDVGYDEMIVKYGG